MHSLQKKSKLSLIQKKLLALAAGLAGWELVGCDLLHYPSNGTDGGLHKTMVAQTAVLCDIFHEPSVSKKHLLIP